VIDLKGLHKSRVTPKFNEEDDQVLDRKINAYTSELYKVLIIINVGC